MELGVYRPRHPEQTTFYRLLENYFEDYVYAYEERFEPKAGPLRAVVRPTVETFLDDFMEASPGSAALPARMSIPFSCQSRNFCPSCQPSALGCLPKN